MLSKKYRVKQKKSKEYNIKQTKQNTTLKTQIQPKIHENKDSTVKRIKPD